MNEMPEELNDPEAIEQAAEAIRQRTRRIRDRMPHHVGGLKASAEHLLEWRRYVRQYPVASMAAAAVVGYWLVPRRSPTLVLQADPSAVQAVQPMLTATGAQPSVLGSLLGSVGGILARTAAAYVGQQAVKLLTPPPVDPYLESPPSFSEHYSDMGLGHSKRNGIDNPSGSY